jgi:hypothetical protein
MIRLHFITPRQEIRIPSVSLSLPAASRAYKFPFNKREREKSRKKELTPVEITCKAGTAKLLFHWVNLLFRQITKGD